MAAVCPLSAMESAWPCLTRPLWYLIHPPHPPFLLPLTMFNIEMAPAAALPFIIHRIAVLALLDATFPRMPPFSRLQGPSDHQTDIFPDVHSSDRADSLNGDLDFFVSGCWRPGSDLPSTEPTGTGRDDGSSGLGAAAGAAAAAEAVQEEPFWPEGAERVAGVCPSVAGGWPGSSEDDRQLFAAALASFLASQPCARAPPFLTLRPACSNSLRWYGSCGGL